MDKPISMSVKEYLMRKLSIQDNIPLKTIEAVIDHQFQEAHKALKCNHSLEISGFARFIFNTKKAIKVLEKNLSKERLFTEKLNIPDLTEKEKASWSLKLENTIKVINQIKPLVEGYAINADTGRVEKQVNPTLTSKGSD